MNASPLPHFIPLTPGVYVSVTDELLANNARYTTTFNGPLPLPPAKHVAVVACMDAAWTSIGSWASTRVKPTSSATPAA
jgi:hypothetical protein